MIMIQVDQTLPDHRLIQYCRTRWNSIYDMFDRLLEQRWAVAAVLSDRSVTTLSDARTLDLADDSWIVMEEMLPVLHSLKCATTALCGESGVSSSMIYPVTATLLTKHLPVAPEESKKVAEYKQTVSVSLKRRLKPDEVESAMKVPFIASFLDPRHKHLKFANDALRDAVKARVKELLSALAVGADAKPEITEENSSESESAGGSAAGGSAAAKRPRYDNKSAMLTLFHEEYHAETPVTPEMELSHYCDEKCIAPHLDPLDWWRMVLNNIIWPGEGDNEDDDGCPVAIKCRIAGYLRQFVETVTEDKRKQLVKFWVGWELPMPDMQMEVIQGDHPTSSTCFHILRLPCHYSSYEQLHDNLESCIATAEYGFGLI
ncbi:hypothetical protein JOQ06_008794 [Pogonophryne albipinna]|uniref:HECT domain-containing protein n=1 Tax=Pogonophryne albipinna TaxID=1090488 RepID=A0AAD6BMZ0_9TELE|nr:hypothetical protein JOQ06_008794 [Pogonophryne albipinna]